MEINDQNGAMPLFEERGFNGRNIVKGCASCMCPYEWCQDDCEQTCEFICASWCTEEDYQTTKDTQPNGQVNAQAEHLYYSANSYF